MTAGKYGGSGKAPGTNAIPCDLVDLRLDPLSRTQTNDIRSWALGCLQMINTYFRNRMQKMPRVTEYQRRGYQYVRQRAAISYHEAQGLLNNWSSRPTQSLAAWIQRTAARHRLAIPEPPKADLHFEVYDGMPKPLRPPARRSHDPDLG